MQDLSRSLMLPETAFELTSSVAFASNHTPAGFHLVGGADPFPKLQNVLKSHLQNDKLVQPYNKDLDVILFHDNSVRTSIPARRSP